MTETIDDLLRFDHERLGALWTRLRGLLGRPDPGAFRLLHEFSAGLRRHIDFEEKELFPTLRRSPRPPSQRAIDSLVADHEIILEELDLLENHLERSRVVEAGEAAARLEIRLEGHNRDEEIGVYHDADHGISAAGHESLITQFRSSSGQAAI